MKEKIKKIVPFLLKIACMLVLYFCVAILITDADKIISADRVAEGYVFLIAGAAFVSIQFGLSMRAISELFKVKAKSWIAMLLKVLPATSLIFSLFVLVSYGKQIVCLENATRLGTLIFSGLLFFLTVFLLLSYFLSDRFGWEKEIEA